MLRWHAEGRLRYVRRDSDLVSGRPKIRGVDVGCTGVSSRIESTVRIARLPAEQVWRLM